MAAAVAAGRQGHGGRSPCSPQPQPDRDDHDAEEPFDELIATLTRQKEELRRTQRLPPPPRPTKSHSAPHLVGVTGESAMPLQVTSGMHGSAAYSFGRRRHRRGSFGLPVLEPRDLEYIPPTGGISVPGAGTYSQSSPDGRDLPATDGGTGGWPWRQHSLFLKTLCDFREVASPEFFDRLEFLMPEFNRKSFTDHLRWLADFDHDCAKKHRKVLRWSEERRGTGSGPTESRREMWLDWKRARMLRQQADDEDLRCGLRDRCVLFRSQQLDASGSAVGGTLRGHPSFSKPPGFSFGRELRDVNDKRHTNLSHVRSTSALDVPGPGAYDGLAGGDLLRKKASSFTMSQRLPAQKVDCCTAGPGFDCPSRRCHGGPAWTFPREAARAEHNSNERKALRDKIATEEGCGPGTYEHATSLHTQFPR